MPKEKDLNPCDLCGQDFEELYGRTSFRQTFAAEWVCKECYKQTYGMEWTDEKENAEARD